MSLYESKKHPDYPHEIFTKLKIGKTKVDVLDVESILDAKNKIKALNGSMESILDTICSVASDEAVKIAKSHVDDMTNEEYRTGNLMDSIRSEKVSSSDKSVTYTVFTDVDYAQYVEFGTGLRGASSPHAMTVKNNKLSKYNQAGKKSWKYYKIINGEKRWYTTSGQPAKPFIYNTYAEFANGRFEEIARKVIKG